MQSMFNPSDNKQLLDRFNKLAPGAKPQWGKMDAAQMLAHAKTTLNVAFGELELKRSLMGILIGGIAKKQFVGGKPFPRNSPTDKHFLITGQRNFDDERNALVALIQRFAQVGPNALTKKPHPFFGKMTPEEWDTLTWKHLDHHLQQFGV